MNVYYVGIHYFNIKNDERMKEFLENLLVAFLKSLRDDSNIDIEINCLIDDYNIPMSLEDKRALVCFVYDLIDEHKNEEIE